MITSHLKSLSMITHRLTQFALVISAFGLILMTVIIGWQVFARYILNMSPSWSESLSLLLMLYYILLAAAVGVYENFHLGLKILVDSVPQNISKVLVIINNLLVAAFGLCMLINGLRLADFTFNHIIPTLHISRSFAYLPFAATGLLISVFALERVLLTFVEETME